MNVGDFRPICQLNGVYKIMAKCLVERLKSLSCCLIGPHQSAFVHDRQILVAFLVAHECIEARVDKGYPGWFGNWTLRRPTIV